MTVIFQVNYQEFVMGLPQVFTGNTMKKISFENGKKYCSYQDPFIGNDNILAMQAMLLGSLLGTNLTQVMLALSLGKNFAVYDIQQ